MIYGIQTDRYKASDVDAPGTTNYYGFVSAQGAWYVLQEVISGTSSTYRFASGTSDYSTNWTNRASLTYDYYHNTFKE